MTLDRLNQFLSLIANLGVMAGLVFLAVELDQNTQATIAAASGELTNQSLEFFSLGMDSQVVARAVYRQSAGEELDPFEQQQLWWHQYFNFRVFENAYLQYRRGFYDESEWDRYRRIISGRLTNDATASQMWRDSAGQWTREFEEEVNSIRDAEDGA